MEQLRESGDHTDEFSIPEDGQLVQDRDYTIIERLTGEGTNSVVFKIQSTGQPPRKYVLKMVMNTVGEPTLQRGSSHYLANRYGDGWKLVSQTPRHSSLVPILHHYHAPQMVDEMPEVFRPFAGDRAFYLVMPVYPESLKICLARTSPSGPAWWINILISMLSAVDHLRSHDLVHGDLKPENFFLHSDGATTGRLALGDFGETWSLMDGAGHPKKLNNREDLEFLRAGDGKYKAPEARGKFTVDEHTLLEQVYDKAEAWTIGFIMVELLKLTRRGDVFERLANTTLRSEALRTEGQPSAIPTQPGWTYDDGELPSLLPSCNSQLLENVVHCLLRSDCARRCSAKEALDKLKTSPTAESDPVALAANDDIDSNAGADAELRNELRLGHKDAAPLSATKLIQALHRARAQVDKEHRACTDAWRTPISLFDERAEQSAKDRGVPAWAIAIIVKAQVLVNQASCIYDRADAYETQIQMALKQGRGLDRAPLLALLEECDVEAERLRMHAELLRKARAAFDHPPADSSDDILKDTSLPSLTRNVSEHGSSGSSSSVGEQAPVQILRPPKQPGSVRMGFLSMFIDVGLELADAAGGAMGLNSKASTSIKKDNQHDEPSAISETSPK